MMRRARERQQGKCNYEATRRTMETWRSYTTPCPVNRYGGPTTEGSAKGRTGVARETRCVQRAHNPREGQTLPGIAHAVVARSGGLAKNNERIRRTYAQGFFGLRSSTISER